MGMFDPDREDSPARSNSVSRTNDDDTAMSAPRRSGKFTAAKRLMFWALIVTLGVVVAVVAVSFLFVTLRGGTLPPTEIFGTIVKVIGNILISLVSE